MARNLVTGGAGFVGKALVAQLRANGESVCSFDLAAPNHPDDIQASILDGDDLRHALKRTDTVFHLAGNAQLWARDHAVFDTVNRMGTQITLDAARSAGVSRFVHCSSLTTLVSRMAPIGPSNADESIELEPEDTLGLYPQSKREAELIVEAAAQDGFHAVTVLPTEPLGAGDTALTPPTQMILDFANQQTPAYINCILNFVPVASLVDGFIAARDKGTSGERYLLGGADMPMKELLTEIGAITERKMPNLKLPYWVALAAGAVDTKLVSSLTGDAPKAPLTGVRLAGRRVSFSSAKAAKALDWRAGPVKPALQEMLEWAGAQGLLKPN